MNLADVPKEKLSPGMRQYADLKEKYHVMSVPCLIINQDKTSFGKKNIQQILELI